MAASITASSRKTRVRVLAVLGALLGLALFGVLRSGGAHADAICSYDAGTKTVTVAADGGHSHTLLRQPDGSIVVAGPVGTSTTCGAATVTNTDTINVTATTGDDTF
ncbi:MAG: hypothetical protein QOF60_1036, partial [Actinomycetota bacterium]|nr:hypothetical protein [Actinomycetota bacterium]